MLRSLSLVLVLALLVGRPPSLEAQATGRITGVVIDSTTRTPVANAQVGVLGTTLGARSDETGRYTIVDVPAGARQLRVLRLGYAPRTAPVVVPAGGTLTADLALTPRAAVLEGVVTTATGETQARRELGNATAEIELPTTGELAAVPSFSSLLTGRTAGVGVQSAGGTTGAGSRIRIRGSNSVSLSNDPIVIIDGIRVDTGNDLDDLSATSLDVGGQVPSRLDDLNPDDIESIEVIKGPAGLALYGTGAANGVIQITTRRGRPGGARWTAHVEAGALREVNDYPNNYRGFGTDVETGQVRTCRSYNLADAACTLDSVAFWNPLERASPFVNGSRQEYGVSVTGGGAASTYYLSAEREGEDGVYEINKLRRTNLRANFRSQVNDRLDLTISTGYLTSDLRLPQNDNNSFGIIPGGYLGSWRDNPVSRGYYQGYPPTDLFIINTRQQVSRFTGSFAAVWQARPWLRLNGVTGLDINSRHDNEMAPGGIVLAEGPPLSVGYRQSNRFIVSSYTTNVGATATRDLPRDLRSTTSVGVQYLEEILRGNLAYGEDLLSGTGSLGGTNSNYQVNEANRQDITLGGYLQQQIAWRDRLFLTGAVRGDDNSAFGADFGFILYPSLQLSYVIGEEPWFPRSDWVSSLRLRAAYGETGQRPTFRQAKTFFTPVTVQIREVETPAVAIGGAGNIELRPERSGEVELGFDLGLLDERLALEATYYDKTTRDALVARVLTPSLGSDTTQFVNLGEVSNRGVEAQLEAELLRGPRVGWQATLSYSANRNRIEDLGADITPIIFGLGTNTQRHQAGYPLGAYFAPPYTYADANGDGFIGAGEVAVAEDPVYLGSPFPTRQVGLSTALTLLERVRVTALAEYRGGHRLYNATEEFRCGVFVNCEALNVPGASLEEQAAAVAALVYATPAGYMEDADFVKLREVAVTLTAPESWAGRLGASALAITVAGRNLGTWTDYGGVDPEVNAQAQSNFNTYDFFTQPLVRYYTSRVTITF